jgi:hypothetical protein
MENPLLEAGTSWMSALRGRVDAAAPSSAEDDDPAGLAFWKNNIDMCNDPAQRPPGQTLAQCIEVQRITTSAAFFLSIEFRQTGGLVRDFYVASLDRPLTNNMPDYVEFMRDTQAIQKGLVVGQGNWQQVLDANRTAFMNEFVMRGEFVALYQRAAM